RAVDYRGSRQQNLNRDIRAGGLRQVTLPAVPAFNDPPIRSYRLRTKGDSPMNKKYLTIAAVVATLVLVAAPFALAQRMHGGPHGGPGELGGVMFLGHLQHAKQALGLSDQQASDIETIFKDLHTQNAQYRESLPGSM